MVIRDPDTSHLFQNGPPPEPEPQAVDPVVQAVRAIVDEVKAVGATAYFQIWIDNNDGAIKLSGSASSISMVVQLEDRVPRMKSIKGVKSVDLSVSSPGS